jgi:hypothetical protein
MKPLSIIEAPLVSEKYVSGVAHMAETLMEQGLGQVFSGNTFIS